MSHADSIRCPECRAEIPLTEVISHQIEEELAAKLAREVAAKEHEFEAREKELRRGFEQAQAAREAELAKRAEEKVATTLADLGSRLEEQDAELRASRERELDAPPAEAAGSTREKEKLDLELARRLDEERQKIASRHATGPPPRSISWS